MQFKYTFLEKKVKKPKVNPGPFGTRGRAKPSTPLSLVVINMEKNNTKNLKL